MRVAVHLHFERIWNFLARDLRLFGSPRAIIATEAILKAPANGFIQDLALNFNRLLVLMKRFCAAMKAKRQTEIRSETHELTIVRFRQSQSGIFCEACADQVSHLKVEQAASALSLSETAIFRLVENGQIHSIKTAAGSLLLCVNSLAAIGMEMERPKGERK